MKLAVYGAGAWGTALAIALSPRRTVTLIARDSAQAELIRATSCNARYLPDCRLPSGLQVTADPSVLGSSDLILIATPVSGLREALTVAAQHAPSPPFLWACKGLESGTGLLPHQVVAAVHPGVPSGVLSGPSFAEEVAAGLPAALTLAGEPGFAARWSAALNGPRLRIYASDDLVGVEVAGAVKNVLAIASGISDGLGLGHNARAALVTRGLAEITRFGVALGARRESFMGLAGMGDLILTCTGDLSRNRRVGLALAAGDSLGEATRKLGHVAEGVGTAREVVRRAKEINVEMPISEAVCAVLDGRLKASDAVDMLMGRDPKSE